MAARIELEVFGNRTRVKGRPAIIGMLVDVTARCAADAPPTNGSTSSGQLIEAIPSPCSSRTNRPRYLGCNKAFEAFLQAPPGRHHRPLGVRHLAPDLAKRYHTARPCSTIPGVQTYGDSVESPTAYAGTSSSTRPPGFTPDGSLGGLVGVITDITERKQTEALVAGCRPTTTPHRPAQPPAAPTTGSARC